jgi:hypothetical protein
MFADGKVKKVFGPAMVAYTSQEIIVFYHVGWQIPPTCRINSKQDVESNYHTGKMD